SSFYRAIDDGLAEAAHDLRPDSRFLRRLNARKRNPRVAYTILLGNAGLMSETERQHMQKSLQELAEHSNTTKFFLPGIDAIISDLDELVEEKGDGLVSLERGRLTNVDDVHVLACDHHVLRKLGSDAGKKLLKIVVQRLE
ncbi:MAG: hypothetical protein ACR2NU_16140, partial [Aeoliella sp.]